MHSSLTGCILGTALGDAIGLPAEGLSRRRQRRIFGELDGHRFVFGRGMVSDDTEHTCLVAEALIRSAGDPAAFEDHLAKGLRWWLASLPAGVGFATLRAVIRLWLGISPKVAGVFSAGNGPAMRSAVIGVRYGAQRDRMRALVHVSTRLTHTDPKAEWAAFAVALAASMPADGGAFQAALAEALGDEAAEFLDLTGAAVQSAERGETTEHFADSLGLRRGVSGYCFHTVPVAIHAWLRHPGDFHGAVLAAIRCGGDTDTTGAITGAIVGSAVGEDGLPNDWLAGLIEWPRSVERMRALAGQLAACDHAETRPSIPFASTLLRNVFFTAVVIVHVLRRLLPPY